MFMQIFKFYFSFNLKTDLNSLGVLNYVCSIKYLKPFHIVGAADGQSGAILLLLAEERGQVMVHIAQLQIIFHAFISDFVCCCSKAVDPCNFGFKLSLPSDFNWQNSFRIHSANVPLNRGSDW